jgi:multiple antibiotic resistance protein
MGFEDIFTIAVPAFVTFFVIIDPIGIAPIFASLTAGTPPPHKFKMAWRGPFVGGLILLFFAFVGKPFMAALGISMAAFRTAGGVLLLLIAIEMVFEHRTAKREARAEDLLEGSEDVDHEDIAVFPIAVPMIAGPGSIATVMLLMGNYNGNVFAQGIVILSLLTAVFSAFIILWLASDLMEKLGTSVTTVLTRVLGIILAALAIQYIFDGLYSGLFS